MGVSAKVGGRFGNPVGRGRACCPEKMGLVVCMFSKYLESEEPSRRQSRLTQGKELGLGQARGEKLVWRA